jgi:hypothetical protein
VGGAIAHGPNRPRVRQRPEGARGTARQATTEPRTSGRPAAIASGREAGGAEPKRPSPDLLKRPPHPSATAPPSPRAWPRPGPRPR